MYNRNENPNVVWLSAAALVAPLSSCKRAKVGAIVVDGSHLAAGYNETEGKLTCGQGGCLRGQRSYKEQPPGGDYSDCSATHAEVSAIWTFLQKHSVTESTKLYSTREPCTFCWAYILGTAGIQRHNVIWSK